jgi:hypothetical protein
MGWATFRAIFSQTRLVTLNVVSTLLSRFLVFVDLLRCSCFVLPNWVFFLFLQFIRQIGWLSSVFVVFLKNIFFVANAFIPQVRTQTMHINSIVQNGIVLIFLKTFYPGGIRTRIFCSWGGRVVHLAKSPGLEFCLFLPAIYQGNLYLFALLWF